jgi:D-arabinose 1-dehydrogenase-like Zn-dependent alcohol dehydrogenase
MNDQVPTVNRQAVLNQPGEAYEIIDGTVPAVGPTQALVNLSYSGCCYT